jgi:hypothetical protein
MSDSNTPNTRTKGCCVNRMVAGIVTGVLLLLVFGMCLVHVGTYSADINSGKNDFLTGSVIAWENKEAIRNDVEEGGVRAAEQHNQNIKKKLEDGEKTTGWHWGARVPCWPTAHGEIQYGPVFFCVLALGTVF